MLVDKVPMYVSFSSRYRKAHIIVLTFWKKMPQCLCMSQYVFKSIWVGPYVHICVSLFLSACLWVSMDLGVCLPVYQCLLGTLLLVLVSTVVLGSQVLHDS